MTAPRNPKGGKPRRAVTAQSLDNAALHYLGRFASSSANLRRVLLRKVARASESGDEAQAGASLIEDLIQRYLRSGLLDDRAYAAQAAASLARRGASRFSIGGRLGQKGVARELVKAALAALDEAGGSELAAACALVRRRRLGPYRAEGARAEWRQKDLATLARAGFGLDLARRVLAAATAEALEAMARGDENSG